MIGFDAIFWGFLFMFDFRIQGIDILPNFIGYLLMYSGLKTLSPYSTEFEKANRYSLPLAFLALFSLYQVQVPVGQVSLNAISIGLYFLGIIVLVLDLLLVYHLCLGIIELAQKEANNGLEEMARNRWKFYLYYKIFASILIPLSLAAPFLLAVGFIPMFVLSIAVLVLMMTLMKNSQSTLRNF